MQNNKTCYKCNETKLYVEFKKYPSNVDGYSTICKTFSNKNCEILINSGATKICTKCKIEKFCTEFYRQYGAFNSFCKFCLNEMNKNNILKKSKNEITINNEEYRDTNKYKFSRNNNNYSTY